MELIDLVKSYNKGEGIIRVIDENGKVIREHFTKTGSSIDFVSAKWLVKTGELKSPHHSID